MATFSYESSGFPDQLDFPAANAFAISKSDSASLTHETRGIYVGGAGDIKVDMSGGQTAITFVGLAAGTVLPIRALKVYSTGTSATNMVGLY